VLQKSAQFLVSRIQERANHIPLGYSWMFAVAVDATMAVIVVATSLQRPAADIGICMLAIGIAVVPDIAMLFTRIDFKPWFMWVTSIASTALFLFATATPIPSDFAPLLLVLMISTTVAMSPAVPGVLAAASAAVLLVGASEAGRLDNLAIYLPVLAMGWLVGFLMQTQRRLMIKQEEAQEAQEAHAVADERRRIAREVHDVIAHSLSITLLHLTGARRELQDGGDSAEAVDALQQAEQLGRQAMADIRRTVGLLDAGPMSAAPEPGVDDIEGLVDDFRRAGLNITMRTSGPTKIVSAAVGLALYRITQESLANVAKHAPDSKCTVTLNVSRRSADLSVTNRLPVPAAVAQRSAGRGVAGMRQRVEILGGAIEVGPADDEWAVLASIPAEDNGLFHPPWCRG
jgi:signal transduction histidine kinase